MLVDRQGTLVDASASPPVDDSTLEAAWRVCADLFCAATVSQQPVGRDCFERELVFCLLSGFGISYEHALSASEHVVALRPFDRTWTKRALGRRLLAEFNRPQFTPPRRDGGLRRYRFPKRKTELLLAARDWLSCFDDVLADLSLLADDRERRTLLCTCPGVGPKTASWLLRNLGLASELAILDVHLLRALVASGRIGPVTLPRDYERAEQAFLDWCRELDAPAAAFDLFVWEWQRGSLRRQ